MESSASCCDRASSLHSLDDIIPKLIEEASSIQDIEEVPIQSALKRVLAEDIVSTIMVPPTNNSAVDGYAIHTSDWQLDQPIEVSMRIPAGTHPNKLEANTAARIFTGATIPEGANAVIMQEDCEYDDDAKAVKINTTPSAQQNIRPAGQDINIDDKVLSCGQILNPQRIGLIASLGKSTVKVYRKLKVAIISTGDELIEPGQTLQPSQIYNSNRYLLQGFLANFNFSAIDMGVVEDKFESTKHALQKASETADVIITTGGASVGEEDHIQSAIKALGEIEFWRVAIKPGKPFMKGTIKGKTVLGLPGNPGAVLVTFLMLARPFLLKSQGAITHKAKSHKAPIGFDEPRKGKRREFLRVQFEDGTLTKHSNQSSGMLSSASWAEGLAVIKENETYEKGDLVDYYSFDALLGY